MTVKTYLPTQQRNFVVANTKKDFTKSEEIAYAITDPWFKCQSLAFIARELTDQNKKIQILKDAFVTATKTKEPNRILKVSAWPIRILAEMKREEWLEDELKRLFAIINMESHPVRRLDAFESLIFALHHGPVTQLYLVVNKFIEACQAARGWRRDRSLQQVALLVKKHNSEKGLELIEMISTPGKKKTALKEFNDENYVKMWEENVDYRFDS